MARLAWISPSLLLPTGLGKVTRCLTKGLAQNGYEIVCGNFQHYGEPIDVDGIAQYSLSSADHFRFFLESVKPDLAIGYFSHWVPPFSQIPHLCEESGIKYLQYLTVECSSVPISWLEPLSSANFLITTSEYGRQVLLKYSFPEDKIKVVHHGVDHLIYRPISGPRFENYEEKFCFGFVARNTIRKGFPQIIRAFAMLPSEIKENSILYLHTQPEEMGLSALGQVRGWDIPLLTTKYNLYGKVLISSFHSKYWGNTEWELARIYNAMDVFVFASTGEGFGLPLIEAMACALPVIASANTSIPEIVGDAGILTPCHEEDDETADGFTISTPKIKPIAEAMIEVYENEKLREELSEKALERSKMFSWAKAITQFTEGIEEALRHDSRIGKEILKSKEPILSEIFYEPDTKFIPEGKGKCLDVGSGKDCLWKRAIEKKGYEYVSLDIQSSPKVEVMADVCQGLPFRDKSFSLVFSRHLLEHLPTEKQMFFVEECRRVGEKVVIIFTTQKDLAFYLDPSHKPISPEIEKLGFIEDKGRGIITF